MKAFTLIEVLIVIALMTSIGFFIIPVSISQLTFARVESYASTISSSIFKQQQNAYSGYQDSEYGVVIGNNSITLYRGDSFQNAIDTSVITFDGVSVSTDIGNSVVHFEKGLKPSSSGSIYVSADGITSEVIVNSFGLVYVSR